MPIIGALAKVERNDQKSVRRSLSQLEGVETFDVDDPELVGLLIEANDVDATQRVLACAVPAVPGVLCAWAVELDMEDDAFTSRKAATTPGG